MTAREIIQARLEHQGTKITPSTIICEPLLYEKLAEYYKDDNWQQKMLRNFMVSYLDVDTLQQRPLDDELEIDGFGSTWVMSKKPWHLEKPGMSEPSFETYTFPSIDSFVEQVEKDKPEAIKQYDADTEHYRIIFMSWGIFEHTWRMRGFENALMDMMLEEDFYRELLRKLTDLYVALIDACADVPADAIYCGDDWGEQRGVIMGKERWREFIRPCYDRVFSAIKKQGKKILHHSCGSIIDIYDDLIEMGMDCHESVQPEANGMEPSLLKERWGNKMSFWGCLGNQSTLCYGTPQEIKEEIFRLHKLFRKDGGYIMAPAKPLPDEMPVEKAVAVVEAVAEISVE